MLSDIFLTKTDSYKINHWNMLPPDTEYVYSYYESRVGAKYARTTLFGLQYILKKFFEGEVIQDLDDLKIKLILDSHFGRTDMLDYDTIEYIVKVHNGRLPLHIKAVPEGLSIPTGNVLMTVVNTDPACPGLTNFVESLLTHVWHPSTVASLSRDCVSMISRYLLHTSDVADQVLPFMLHDFGYRGATCDEAANIAGLAHLLNSRGTDTIGSLFTAVDYYGHPVDDAVGNSIPATEHSIMTAEGREAEESIVGRLLDRYPTGLISIVADSYDYYNFVTNIIGGKYRDKILARDGKVVVRPDSTTSRHKTPEELSLWTLIELEKHFGSSVNNKKYTTINPKVGAIWGDGIDPDGISWILDKITQSMFSADNMVFGMGGGLHQKDINRDTQRFAFKSSAQMRDGTWHDVFKDPLDSTKRSKRGRLKLVKSGWLEYETVPIDDPREDVMKTVFHDGWLQNEITFEQARFNASVGE